MADKLTLLELHLHAEDNEFESDMEFSSDIAELLRDRLGFGSDEEDETDEFDIGDESEDDSLTSVGSADGGDTMELEEETDEAEETETGSAVVEIDRDSDLVDEDEEFEEEDDSGGRSWGRILLVFALLIAGVYLARSYLGGDDFEDEFEEL